jgi:hypothetical protein
VAGWSQADAEKSRLAITAPAPGDELAGRAIARPAAMIPIPAAAPLRRPTTIESLRITRELPETRWLPPGEFIWDADAARTANGRAVVVVNLRARVLSVYKGGVEVGRSSILYGAPDKPTPLGTFPILEKRRDHVSNIYNAPMPHMQRLTWDGVALHGSPRLGDNLATNGCVGLPREFAALLFAVTQVGDEVIVWSGLPGRA